MKKSNKLSRSLKGLEQLESRELLSASPWNADAALIEANAAQDASALFTAVAVDDDSIDLSAVLLDPTDASATLTFSNYDATARTVTYSWDGFDPEETGLYRVQYSSNGGETFKNLTTKTSDTERTATSVAPGKTYVFRVFGLDANNANTSEYALGIFAPISLTASAKNFTVGTEISVSVSSADASAEYQWYRGDEAIAGATSASYVPTADDFGFPLKVVATGTGWSLGSSAEATFVSTLAAPTNPTVSNYDVGARTVSISWDASFGATDYVLYLSKNDGGFARVGTVDATERVATQISPGTKYVYRIYAQNGSERSAEYAEATFAPFVASLDKTVFNPAGDTIAVTALPDAAQATYQWYRRVGGEYVPIDGATESTYETTQEDAGLYLKVVATGYGTSVGVTKELIAVSDVPSAPTTFSFGA